MTWRNKLNERPMLIGGIVAAILVLLVGYWLIWGLSGGTPQGPTNAFYTTDDGATWFSGDADETPPFQHEGKPAVRAYLYKCADGKEFVGYLERYSDQAKATLDQFKADRDAGKPIANSQAVANAEMNGKQVKRPGEQNWTNASGRTLGQITSQITCPDKSTPQPVE